MDNKKIFEKVQTRIAISNFSKEENKVNRPKLMQIAATFVIGVGLTLSTVHAGTTVYEKIFKKPEVIEDFAESLEVTEEDEQKMLTEEEAFECAKNAMKRYGYDMNGMEVKEIETWKNPNLGEITYVIKTEKINVWLDSFTGEFSAFEIEDDLSLKEIEDCNSNREEMTKLALDKIEEYGYAEEYELVNVNCNLTDNEDKAYFWYFEFCKKYDGIVNEYQSVYLTIIPKINLVSKLSYRNDKFDNNEIIITEDEAIQIAKEKDKIVNTENYEISNIISNIEIKKMNAEVYLKENGLDRGNATTVTEDGTVWSYNKYKTSDVASRVYVVTVEYTNRDFYNNRQYYVDVTTGEVIGGRNIFDR